MRTNRTRCLIKWDNSVLLKLDILAVLSVSRESQTNAREGVVVGQKYSQRHFKKPSSESTTTHPPNTC